MASAFPADLLSKQDCLTLLEIIHGCSRSLGEAGLGQVWAGLSSLVPLRNGVAVISARTPAAQADPVIRKAMHHGAQGWFDTYFAQGIQRVDPVVQRSFADHRPYRWSDAQRSHPTDHPGYREMKRQLAVCEGVAGVHVGRHPERHLTFIALGLDERSIPERHLFILGQVLPHVHTMLEAVSERPAAETAASREIVLTAREFEVLKWVAAGKTNWEIGRILSVSERTVKFHLANLLVKLDATTRTQAVAQALRQGLLAA